jgi:23S rRNA pseudouridine2605 synthase
MERFANAHSNHAPVLAIADFQIHLSRLDQKRLVFLPVILTGELVAGVNVKNLSDVPVGLRPNDLVAPGLVHASHPETVYAIRRGMATVRLQKVLAHAGVASRRAAEQLISAGRVRVDGHVVTELGTKVDPRDSRVEVDGQRIVREPPVYVVLHKPRGVVATMRDPEGRPSVRDLLAGLPGRIYPVGRLDFNTSGVLLATNDGQFAETLLHPRRAAPKTYIVKLQGVMEPKDVDRWRGGVELEDGKTLPAKVKLLRHESDKTWLELTITEGRNLQIRRMGDATGFRVMRLARTSFAGVESEGLAPGRWRYLTADELSELKKQYGVPKRIVSQNAQVSQDAKVREPPRDVSMRPRHPAGRSRDRLGPGAEVRERSGEGPPPNPRGRARRDARMANPPGFGARRGSGGRPDRGVTPSTEVGGRGTGTPTPQTGRATGSPAVNDRLRGRHRP